MYLGRGGIFGRNTRLADGNAVARSGLWIAAFALLFWIFSPSQAYAFDWNKCVSPNPLAFASKTATPTLILIGGGANTDSDGNTCDPFDLGFYASNTESPSFANFTATGASGATYTFDFLPCNFVTSGGPGSGGCAADGSASFNTYYAVSVSSTSVTSDTVTLFVDPTASGTATQPLTLQITIVQAPVTTTTIASSLNPATFPQTETFTATVTSTSTVNEGTVTFKSDGSAIAGCGAQPVSNGQATCSAVLPAGSHSVFAIFNGDANFATSSSSLTQVVNSAVAATQSIASVTLTQNVAANFTPVTGSGGTAPLSYSVSPSLPAGLSLNASTGAITGSPTVTHAASSFTVTVTDANSENASNTFQLTVNTPATATQSIPSVTLTQNKAPTAFTPVTGGGGTSPLSFSVSPTLPSGLSMSSATGAISGTPTVTHAASSYTVTVTDANGSAASNTFTLTVNPAVSATQSVATITLTQGRAATTTTPVTGSGGTGTLTYSISPGLPTGLSFNTSTGAVSGTPTVTSVSTTYTVTVTDANSATASNTFILSVNTAVTATQSVASTALTQNHAASFTPVTGGGGTGALTYGISPSLPAGLSFNASTGAVTGTPTVTSSATTYTVTVTDINSATASNTFSLTVNAPVTATQAVASTTLTQNKAATSFTPVTGSGGTGTLAHSVSPSLPTGLSISASTGAITGTPTVTSTATTFTVTITDAVGATATNTFTLTVNSAVTATQSAASTSLTANHAATAFIPVTGGGGTGSLSYGVAPGLPAGLSMDTTSGRISGTPTSASATTTYTVTVTDTNGATASNTFTLTVNGTVSATTVIASKGLTVNHAVTSFTPVTGGGGTGALSYTVSPTLPAGVAMNVNSGSISGLPTATSGAQTYTVTVTDSVGATASATFSLAVNSNVTASTSIVSTTLTQNRAATSFTPVTGGGGTTPLTYTVSPSLPAGLSINTTSGAVTGTPTVTSAATSYTVTVTDANGATATASFSLTVNPAVTATQAIASTSLTQNKAATPFTPVTGGGGTGSLSYSIAPSLPAGLSISTSNGAITGTPTAIAATTTYTVTVTDTNGATASAGFSLTVNGAVIATQAIASTNLTQNKAATAFTPVTGSGGTGALTYSVSPSLPAGLSINSANGAITGTPSATSATRTYTVTVTDTNGASASNSFSLTVNSTVTATQAVAATMLTQSKAATSFTPVTGSGGTPPLSYSVSPSLPAGLSVNSSTGAITGMPTVASAARTFTVVVTDANGATGSNTFNLTVNGAVTATQAVASTVLTQNRPATAFTPVTASGGTGALTFGVSPALPAGLSFNTANGAVTGTPTVTSAAATYTVTATDTNGATATATFSLTVNGVVTAVAAIPSSTLLVNQAVTHLVPVTGSGGTGSLTYAVSPALPAGLTFNIANGVISGTPTTPTAAASFTVTVTDTLGSSATASFTLTVGVIATKVAVTSSLNPSSFRQPVTFTATVTGSGGTPGGNVTFNDGGVAIGTVALASGIAAFTTSSLTTGSHTITASYAGNATYGPSTSPALAQTVNIPVDSVRLRAMQLNVTRMVAQSSGQAISGAIDDAITEGFDAGGAFVNPSRSGIRFNFAADEFIAGEDDDQGKAGAGKGGNGSANAYTDPNARPIRQRTGSSRIDDAFSAIDPPKKAPKKFHEERDWLFWVDVRGSGVDRWASSTAPSGMLVTQSTLHGLQLNALMGVSYKLTPNFLVGLLGGYETFNYVEDDINGRLSGDGWTVGSYLGWKINPTLRYDAAVTYSGIGYNGTAGTAQGNFSGNRWMISTGLTGRYAAAGFMLEPSAKVYALWENENAYVDSLGTQQGSHDFGTGRASAGIKASYPITWTDSILLLPYLGAYGDYYFTSDNAAEITAAGGVPLASTPLLQGWSARLTAGLGAKLPGGARIAIGGEYGGIGSDTRIWTATAKAQIPFGAQ